MASRRMSAEEVLQSIMDSYSDDWSCESEGDDSDDWSCESEGDDSDDWSCESEGDDSDDSDDSDADIAVRDRDATNSADEDVGDVNVELQQGAATQATPAQVTDTNAGHEEIFVDAQTAAHGPDNSPAARDDAAWTKRNDKPTFPEFSARPGITVQPPEDATPYWFVNLYFVLEFWQLLVTGTNRYAAQCIAPFHRRAIFQAALLGASDSARDKDIYCSVPTEWSSVQAPNESVLEL